MPPATAPSAGSHQALHSRPPLARAPQDTVTRTRPALGALFVRALEVAVAAPAAAPTNKPLRARYCSLLHRLVELLGPGLLPYLPPALEVGHEGRDALWCFMASPPPPLPTRLVTSVGLCLFSRWEGRVGRVPRAVVARGGWVVRSRGAGRRGPGDGTAAARL